MGHEIKSDPTKKAAARPPYAEDVIDRLRQAREAFAAAGSGAEGPRVGGPSTTPEAPTGFWAKVGVHPGLPDAGQFPARERDFHSYYAVRCANDGGVSANVLPGVVVVLPLEPGRYGVCAAQELNGRRDVPEGAVVWMTWSEAAPPRTSVSPDAGGAGEGVRFVYHGPAHVRAEASTPGPAPPDPDDPSSDPNSPDYEPCKPCVGTAEDPAACGVCLVDENGEPLTPPACVPVPGTLLVPRADACGWEDIEPVVLHPADAASGFVKGRVYAAALKAQADPAAGTPAVYAAAGDTLAYRGVSVTYCGADLVFCDARVTYCGSVLAFCGTDVTFATVVINVTDSTVNHYNTTVTYVNSVINWTDTSVNLTNVIFNLLSPVYVYGVFPWMFYSPVFFGYGILVCGWTWYCAETHAVHDGVPLDLTVYDSLTDPKGPTPPHTVARLIPLEQSSFGIELPDIIRIEPPLEPDKAGQFLWCVNVGLRNPATDPKRGVIRLGEGFLVPGPSALPVRLKINDAFVPWFDPDAQLWRTLAFTHGDFRFEDSAPLTVAKFNPGRELTYVPRGNEGDFLVSRMDLVEGVQAPVWEPITGEATVYKTDCVDGQNQRYKSTLKFVSGRFVQTPWVHDSPQGCCDCAPECCPNKKFCLWMVGAPTPCTAFDGKYVLTYTGTPCVYSGTNENGVTATLDITDIPSSATLLFDDGADTQVYYEAGGTFPTCDYGVLSWASTSEFSPCVTGVWPGTPPATGIQVYAGGECEAPDPNCDAPPCVPCDNPPCVPPPCPCPVAASYTVTLSGHECPVDGSYTVMNISGTCDYFYTGIIAGRAIYINLSLGAVPPTLGVAYGSNPGGGGSDGMSLYVGTDCTGPYGPSATYTPAGQCALNGAASVS